jgi:hypothetical protein
MFCHEWRSKAVGCATAAGRFPMLGLSEENPVMHLESLPRQRHSRPIVLSGVLCAAALLAGCGDDEDQRHLSPQVAAAEGTYRTNSSSGTGSSGVTTWRTANRSNADDSSSGERDGSKNGGQGNGSDSDSQRSSQRGGFGSSGHGFFHFGG